MKKNNKGFFLAETIIMIALVTTIIAFLYPNVSKLYENYNNRVKYYDQTEDLYTLKAVYEYMKETAGIVCNKCEDTNGIDLVCGDGTDVTCPNIGKLKKLYITKYMASPKDDDDLDFNKYLHRLKKTHNDTLSYRLIGIFEGNRYASIKIAGIDVIKN